MIPFIKNKKIVLLILFIFRNTILLPALVKWELGEEQFFDELFLENCTCDQCWQENNFSPGDYERSVLLVEKTATVFTIKPVTY